MRKPVIAMLAGGTVLVAFFFAVLVWGMTTTKQDVSIHNGCVISKTERNWDNKVLRVERVCP